ncbi:MAG: DUF3619 family protein [Pseudomonadota bacterium]
MTDPDNEHSQWKSEVSRTLDASQDDIDGATLGRLRAARREALSRQIQKPLWQRPQIVVPCAACAVAILTIVNLQIAQRPQISETPLASTGLLEDLPLLSGEDNLDMLGELEFYIWLEEAGQDLG